MDIPVSFKPDGARASFAAAMMKQRLARSIAHIIERAAGHVDCSASGLETLIAALSRNARISPEVFGIYNDILGAVSANDLDRVGSLFRRLGSADFELRDHAISRLDASFMGKDKCDRYRRYADCDAGAPLNLRPPGDDEFRAVCSQLDQATHLLEAAVPECAEEIAAIVSETVIAMAEPSDTGYIFDGLSTFRLWGALFLNPYTHATALDVLETLVHEVSHTLLFAFSVEEPLVTNPLGDRFPSPLRDDLRPMDGVYHATYVLARMHYAISRLHAAGILDRGDQDAVASRMTRYAGLVVGGLATIRGHGQLTDTGRVVLLGAEDYMSEVACSS